MPARWFAVAAVVGIALFVSFQTVQTQQANSEKAKPQQPATPPTGSTSQHGPAQDQGSGNKGESTQDRTVDWVQALATIAAVAVGIGTLKLLERQTQATLVAIRMNKKVAAIAKLSADAAVASAELAKREQRAWVGLSKMNWRLPAAGQHLWFEGIIDNTGKTPAIKSNAWIRLKSFKPSDQVNFQQAQSSTITSVGLISPGQLCTLPVESDVIMTTDAINAINTGEIVIYVMGLITYEDIFGVAHWHSFCLVYEPTKATLHHYNKYNDCDRD